MNRSRSTLAGWTKGLLVGALLCIAAPHAAPAADTCTKGLRSWVRGAPTFREYTCAIGGQELRLTFLRLNEGLAGNLVLDEPTPEIQNFFGSFKIVDNEVLQALKPLFSKFGQKRVYRAEDLEFAINISAPTDDGEGHWKSFNLPPVRVPNTKYRRIWTLSTPFGDYTERYQIFPGKDLSALSKSKRWPPNTKMTYTCLNDAILCAVLWRFAQVKELRDIARSTERVVKRMYPDTTERSPPSGASDTEGGSSWPEPALQFRNHFELFEHIGSAGWPADFLLLSASAQDCDRSFAYYYHARPLALDVAVFENASQSALHVRDLLGSISQQRGLRHAGKPGPAPGGKEGKPLMQPSVSIEPGQKVIVPLRILFLEAAMLPGDFKDAEKMFQRIRGIRKGAVFTSRGYAIGRDSFLAPELPSQAVTVYGPEIGLAGLFVSAGGREVDRKAWNRVVLSTVDDNYERKEEEGTEQPEEADPAEPVQALRLHQPREVEGSCPYLYAFDSAERVWVNHGKTIESANTPDKEATSVVRVHPSMRRFRLAEEEPEISYVRSVKLVLTLRDGRTVALEPNLAQSRPAGAFQFVVPAFAYVEFTFDVPAEYERTGVVESALAVTGHYTRLSGFETARAERH
jgi:hypothetical protein